LIIGLRALKDALMLSPAMGGWAKFLFGFFSEKTN
jgi:hypothetical protein